MAGLMDAMGYGGSDSEDMPMKHGDMSMKKDKSEPGNAEHYKGFAKRLKMALDSGNDARAKQLLRDCIEEVLGEE